MSTQLEQNLQNILTQKETYLLPENLRAGITALGVTGTYEGGGSGDVKLFSTVEEMNADVPSVEGELAIVYKNTSTSIEKTTEFSTLLIKPSIMSPEKITDSISAEIFGGGEFRLYVDDNRCEYMIYGDDVDLRVEYTTSDAIHYTLDTNNSRIYMNGEEQTVSPGAVDLGATYTFNTEMAMWDEKASWFLFTGELYFGGVYSSIESETAGIYVWNYLDLGTSLNSIDQLLPGVTAYTNNGFITGDSTVYNNLDDELVVRKYFNIPERTRQGYTTNYWSLYSQNRFYSKEATYNMKYLKENPSGSVDVTYYEHPLSLSDIKENLPAELSLGSLTGLYIKDADEYIICAMDSTNYINYFAFLDNEFNVITDIQLHGNWVWTGMGVPYQRPYISKTCQIVDIYSGTDKTHKIYYIDYAAHTFDLMITFTVPSDAHSIYPTFTKCDNTVVITSRETYASDYSKTTTQYVSVHAYDISTKTLTTLVNRSSFTSSGYQGGSSLHTVILDVNGNLEIYVKAGRYIYGDIKYVACTYNKSTKAYTVDINTALNDQYKLFSTSSVGVNIMYSKHNIVSGAKRYACLLGVAVVRNTTDSVDTLKPQLPFYANIDNLSEDQTVIMSNSNVYKLSDTPNFQYDSSANMVTYNYSLIGKVPEFNFIVNGNHNNGYWYPILNDDDITDWVTCKYAYRKFRKTENNSL